jgi:hypothetical protein
VDTAAVELAHLAPKYIIGRTEEMVATQVTTSSPRQALESRLPTRSIRQPRPNCRCQRVCADIASRTYGQLFFTCAGMPGLRLPCDNRLSERDEKAPRLLSLLQAEYWPPAWTSSLYAISFNLSPGNMGGRGWSCGYIVRLRIQLRLSRSP